jgi:hypothetical protein
MVVYLLRGPKNNKQVVGTGFFLAVPMPRDGAPDARALYLITAKHVAAGLGATFWMRANLHTGKSRDTECDGTQWIQHPEWSKKNPIDVVALLIREHDLAVNFNAQNVEPFVVDDPVRFGISLGDEAVILGHFGLLPGEKRNTPLARFGTIAMFPDDKVWVKITEKESRQLYLYLLEVHSLSGMSGCPVFVYQRFTVMDGLGRTTMSAIGGPVLLGLMRGHWPVPKKEKPKLGASGKDLNLGISLVVPGKQILETIMRKEAVIEREEWLDRLIERGNAKKHAAVLDGDA